MSPAIAPRESCDARVVPESAGGNGKSTLVAEAWAGARRGKAKGGKVKEI